MKFKGFNVRRAPSVVLLEGHNDTDGNRSDDPLGGHYARFGRICKSTAKGAEIARGIRNYNPETGQYDLPVYAKPVTGSYSRTDMMYGDDGKVYVCKDMTCYTAPMRRTF